MTGAVLVVWSWFYALALVRRWHRLGGELFELDPVCVEAIFYLLWAVITPPLIYVSSRLPVRRPHRARNAFLLTLAGFTLSIVPPLAFAALANPVYLKSFLGQPAALAIAAYDGVFLAAFIIVGMQYLRLSEENLARLRAEAELTSEIARTRLRQLRSNLHPHFLFNALNAVSALLRDRPADARRVLRILSELLHRSFAWSQQEIRLAEEVGFAERYLEIQRVRFRGRLAVTVDVAPELADCAVPPLILQPLVENAVIHGVAPFVEGGTVAVLARRDGLHLRLTVRDSGPGVRDTPRDRPALGIANVRARLRLLYGDRQELRLERSNAAFDATIVIPLPAAAREAVL